MKLISSREKLPPPRVTAEKIKFTKNKFNDYPYLILALLDKVPQLRGLPDENVALYHHSVRKILIRKYKKKGGTLII